MRRISSTLCLTAPLLLLVAACHRSPEPTFQPEATSATGTSASDTGGPSAGGDQGSAANTAQGSPSATGASNAQASTAPAPGTTAAPAAGQLDPHLLNPALDTETAPARYTVELDTTKGKVLIDVTRSWSPHGADRFYNLVKIGFFTNVAFFRVLDGFMAQAGIHGNPQVATAWHAANIPDDPVVKHNTRGMVSFATAGPNTRSTQFFINYKDNSRLDTMGFSPFGKVRDMHAVDALYSGYGEGAPSGQGPSQARMQTEGNAYLHASFPRLDYIQSAHIVPVH